MLKGLGFAFLLVLIIGAYALGQWSKVCAVCVKTAVISSEKGVKINMEKTAKARNCPAAALPQTITKTVHVPRNCPAVSCPSVGQKPCPVCSCNESNILDSKNVDTINKLGDS